MLRDHPPRDRHADKINGPTPAATDGLKRIPDYHRDDPVTRS